MRFEHIEGHKAPSSVHCIHYSQSVAIKRQWTDVNRWSRCHVRRWHCVESDSAKRIRPKPLPLFQVTSISINYYADAQLFSSIWRHVTNILSSVATFLGKKCTKSTFGWADPAGRRSPNPIVSWGVAHSTKFPLNAVASQGCNRPDNIPVQTIPRL